MKEYRYLSLYVPTNSDLYKVWINYLFIVFYAIPSLIINKIITKTQEKSDKETFQIKGFFYNII
mgnify:CR=1 FL=1|jgi:hypothetical protein